MPIPIFDAPAYAQKFVDLLPRGRAWSGDGDSTILAVMGWLSPTYARNHARAAYLLTDAFPSTTTELLPKWEATLGLPDPCAGESPTLAQRRAHVVARFVGDGGQSPAYFIGYALNLGYTITITQFVPSRFGAAKFGNSYLRDEWAHVWQINAPLQTVVVSPFGAAQFGDPYQSWGNAVLECEMNAIKPAHTTILFHYS
jgi:uncharacterized protein YmfQ (DUF2313 family)